MNSIPASILNSELCNVPVHVLLMITWVSSFNVVDWFWRITAIKYDPELTEDE